MIYCFCFGTHCVFLLYFSCQAAARMTSGSAGTITLVSEWEWECVCVCGLCAFSIHSVGLFAFPRWDKTELLGMSPTVFPASMSNLNHPEVMIYCFYYNTLTRMHTHTQPCPLHIHNTCIFRCINTDMRASSYKRNTNTLCFEVLACWDLSCDNTQKLIIPLAKQKQVFVIENISCVKKNIHVICFPFPIWDSSSQIVIQKSEEMINESNSDPCAYLLCSECVPCDWHAQASWYCS